MSITLGVNKTPFAGKSGAKLLTSLCRRLPYVYEPATPWVRGVGLVWAGPGAFAEGEASHPSPQLRPQNAASLSLRG